MNQISRFVLCLLCRETLVCHNEIMNIQKLFNKPFT